ncbi:hypothetical protein Tco_0122413 [Tanacetum coccineum]
MEGNDDGQDSDKNKLIFKVKMIDSDDENVEKEVEKNVVELANEAATKSVEELFAILENDVDNMENDVEDEEANLVEEQESEQADNEEDSEENDDINQIFNNIQTMPFLNTATRSNKNQVGKGLTKTVVDEAKKKNKEEQIEKKRS